VAAHYGVHTSSVWRWIRESYLPEPEKNFGSLRFDKTKVIEALKNVNVKRMKSEESDD